MTIFKPLRALPSAALGASSTSEIVFQDASGNAIILPLPSGGQLAGAIKRSAMFKIYAWGRVTGGTTTNFTAQLQYGTSTTPGSNTDIESAAAVAVNSVSGVWSIEATLIVDDASAKIDGYCIPFISGSTVTLTAQAKADNTITSVDPDAGTSILGFVITGTFSASNASNAAYLDGFVMQEIG